VDEGSTEAEAEAAEEMELVHGEEEDMHQLDAQEDAAMEQAAPQPAAVVSDAVDEGRLAFEAEAEVEVQPAEDRVAETIMRRVPHTVDEQRWDAGAWVRCELFELVSRSLLNSHAACECSLVRHPQSEGGGGWSRRSSG
jgi:hypothetical protein